MIFNFDIIRKYQKRFFAVSAYLWSSIIPAGVNVLLNPFLAKNLSPYDYSVIGYFSSFNLLVLPIVGFSFISYYSRNYFLVDEIQRIKIRNTLLTSTAVFGIVLMIVFICSFYIYANKSKLTLPFYPYAIISFLPTFFSLFFSLYLTDKKMERNPGMFLKASLFNSFLIVILTMLLVVVFKFGALGRLSAILIVSIFSGFFGFFSLITKIEIDKIILFNAIKFCWPLALSAILYYFLSGIDRLFLERLNNNTDFGYYNVAFQISSYTSLIGTALFQTFDPDIYKATANRDFKRLIQIIIVISLPCLCINLLFIILANPLINILTYGKYIKATSYAKILAVRNILTPLCFVISDIIVGLGYSRIELYNRIFGGVFSILIYKYLISKYGFVGAAWGQSVSLIIMCCISMSFFAYQRKTLFKNNL